MVRVIGLFSHWNQVRDDLLNTIEQFDDDELDYVPFPNSWSVGEILLHIANAEEGWFQFVVRREYDQWPAEFRLKDHPGKDKIKLKLLDVHDRTMELLKSFEAEDLDAIVDYPWDGKGRLGWIIWHVIEHEIHH